MNPRKLYRRILLLAAAALPAAVHAEPLVFLRAALDNNSDYRQASAGIASALENVKVAQAARLPQVRGQGSYELSKPEGSQMQPARRGRVNVNLTQQLFNRANDEAVEVARLRLELARQRAAATRQQVLLETFTAYLAASLAQENIELVDGREATLREQLNLARGLFEVGKANRLQILNVEAQLASLAAERIAARSARDQALGNLARLSGNSTDTVLRLLRRPDLPVEAVADWQQRAGDAPAVKVAATELQMQEAANRQLDYSIWPALEAAASTDLDGAHSLHLNLAVPLYSSGGATAARQAAREQVQALAAAYDARLDESRLAAANAWRDVRDQQAQLEALLTSVRLEKERLAVAQTSIEFKSGVLGDALNAEADLATAELRLLQSRHAQLRAWLALLAATGRLNLDYSSQLSGVFE